MKNLNRFEYLQLAAQLLPKEHLIKQSASGNPDQQYVVLVEEMFLLAKIIQEGYESRYRYESEADPFELLNHFERGNL